MTLQAKAVPVLTKFHQNQFPGSNSSSKSGKRKKLVSTRAAHQNHDCPMLFNKPESLINEAMSLINEAMSLISIDDSSVKLTRNEEPNIIYLHLERGGH